MIELVPKAESIEALLVAWHLVLESVTQLVWYVIDKKTETLYASMMAAYASVADKAAADQFGTIYNTGFGLDDLETEKANPECSSEMEFQLNELERTRMSP